jgi:hypothetical protein
MTKQMLKAKHSKRFPEFNDSSAFCSRLSPNKIRKTTGTRLSPNATNQTITLGLESFNTTEIPRNQTAAKIRATQRHNACQT